MNKNLPANTGDTVRPLVQKDSTCHGAVKPLWYNYWAHKQQRRKLTHLEYMPYNEETPLLTTLEEAHMQQ